MIGLQKTIPLFSPAIFKEEWLKALEVQFDSGWISQGPRVAEFENSFKEKFGYKYCVGVNSGSSALELIYNLLDINEGDEVLTSVLTCTATNLPLLRRRADIKFVDVSHNLTMDYADLYRKISSKTKAVVVVTLGGLPIDNRIFWIASQLNVPVVVDACQSLGVREARGNFVAYSFQAIKSWSCSDGGLLVCNTEQDYKRAKLLRWFGIDREKKTQVCLHYGVEHQAALNIEEPGYKFHMNDIMAALCLVGLKHNDEILEHRKQLSLTYASILEPYISCIYGGSYWLFGLLSNKRYKIIEHLRAKGIGADMVHLRNDIFSVFGGARQPLPNINRFEEQYFYIPLHTNMNKEDAKYIASEILTCL